MDNNYLTFDEAVSFLKTNTSTLYKWLQTGKVPGHKLGRQWRFIREELQLWLASQGQDSETRSDTLAATKFLAARNPSAPQDQDLLSLIIQDAVAHHAAAIHFIPAKGRYALSYRINGKIKPVIDLSEELFEQLHLQFIESSFPLQNNNARGAYLQKNPKDKDRQLQIFYQKLETINGTRITLKIIPGNLKLFTLEQIARDPEIEKKFSTWAEWNSGIIVVSGMFGNGMTTSACAFLNHVQNKGKNVFLIQDSPEILFPQLPTVEVLADDEMNFKTVLKQVMSSDCDAIGVTFDPASELKQNLLNAAFRAASAGHLVIIQYNVPSCETVLEKIKQYAPDILENKIKLGISHQTLIPTADGKRRPEYQLLEVNAE